MKILLSIICILLSSQVFSQISIREKKGKYSVYSESGKKLLKKLDSAIVFENSNYLNYFATVKDGYYSIWKYENDGALNTILEGNYSSAYILPYARKELMADDFFGNRFVVSTDGTVSKYVQFAQDSIREGRDNSGRSALCTSNSNITPYIYTSIYRIQSEHESWYEAQTDSGAIVLNSSGEVIYAIAMDDFFTSAYHESVLIGRKGKLWSVVDFSDTFNLPPTQLLNPYWVLNMDGPSFASLDYTQGIFIEKGKQGVIDFYGNIIVPADYDIVRESFTSYKDKIGDYVNGPTSYALKPDSLKNKWVFLDRNLKIKHTILEDEFISSNELDAIFITENQVKIYDLETGKQTDFISRKYPDQFVIRGNAKYGVADKSGAIILPLEFSDIRKRTDINGYQYYDTYKDKKCHLFNSSGECLTEGIDFTRIGRVCHGGADYFRLTKRTITGNKSKELEGMGKLMDRKFSIIIPIEFEYISCSSKDESKPIATGMKDDKKYVLYRDGRVELLE